MTKSADNIQIKRKKLLDNFLNEIIVRDIYEETDVSLQRKLSEIKAQIHMLESQIDDEKSLRERIVDFRRALSKDEVLEEFLAEYDELDKPYITMEDIDFTCGYIEL